MRKTSILLLSLVVIFFVAVVVFKINIDATVDDVVYTHETLYGDISRAEGVQITNINQLDRRLVWRSELLPDGSSETEFEYYRDGHSFDNGGFYPYGIMFNNYNIDVWNGPDDWTDPTYEAEGLERAFQELFWEAPNGGELEKTIFLKDYIDYYPMVVEFAFNQTHLYEQDYFYSHYDENVDKLIQIALEINKKFKIPVLEHETIDINVRKNSEGQSTGGGYSTGEDTYQPFTLNALSDDACYFTFEAKTNRGTLVDTSELELGYGIYRLPITTLENGETEIHAEKLEMIFPLDPTTEIEWFELSPDNSKLYLSRFVEDMYTITVIDTETSEVLQTLEVASVEGDGENNYRYVRQIDGEGFFALSFSNDKIAVVTIGENQLLNLEFIVEKQDEFANIVSTFSKVAFDGERLALVGNISYVYDYVGECDVYLAIYEKEGLTYFGKYANSLSGKVEHYDFYDELYIPFPEGASDEAYEVRFN